MYFTLRISIVLLLADYNIVNFRVMSSDMVNVAESFKAIELVPDLIPTAPDALVTVTYPGNVSVELGNELSLLQVQKMPRVSYEADPDQFYTLVFVDPDLVTRDIRRLGEFKHWLVGNIPGSDLEAGETLAPYLGSIPPPLTGLHRYTFLIYQQPCKLTFDESLLLNVALVDRIEFTVTEFVKKYDLGDPIAGNFYLCEFDSSVDIGVELELGKLLGNKVPINLKI